MDKLQQIALESREGFDLTLTAYFDYDSSPDTDYDIYTPKQIEAWRNDEWHFVTLEVTAWKQGVNLGSDYLGGVEYGHYLATDEHDNELCWRCIDLESLVADGYFYLGEMIETAIEEARQTILALVA